jgi:hypothetical protein
MATVFERNCGATTDYVTAVSIREAGTAFSGDRWGDVFRIKGLPRVSVSWAGPRVLVIKRPPLTDKIFAQELNWKNQVTITYVDGELPASPPWSQPPPSKETR